MIKKFINFQQKGSLIPVCEVKNFMMYPYMTLGKDIEIVHSHLIRDNDVNKVIVHFERATENGFDVARCELPSYSWLRVEGFSKEEIELFTKLLQSNEKLIFKYAANGGIKIA